MEATSETTVYVVGDDGEIRSAAEVAVSALRKGTSPGVGQPVEKGSRQLSADKLGGRWVEPRIRNDALLQFLDWNTWHRRCCVLKALMVAGLGWSVERDGEVVYDVHTGDGDLDDPVVRVLLQPSPDDPTLAFEEFAYRVMLDYWAVGNAYFEVVRDRRGRVAELYHVPARTMRRGIDRESYWQVKTRQRRFAAFRRRAEAAEAVGGSDLSDAAAQTAASEIVHLYEYDPLGDDYGMPGWVGALASMGLDRTVLEFNTRLFQNSMMAHMAIVVEGGRLSKEGRDAIKRFVRERAQGVENAGRVLLIEDENDRVKVRFEKLNLEIKDLMLKDVQNHFRDTVIAAHGVPPRLLGVAAPGQLGATGEVEGQLRTYRETVVRPSQRKLSALFEHVFADAGGSRGRYALRFVEMDTTGSAVDAALLKVVLDGGLYEPEEARALLERIVGVAGGLTA
jgi:PBSX family phage portal protein